MKRFTAMLLASFLFLLSGCTERKSPDSTLDVVAPSDAQASMPLVTPTPNVSPAEVASAVPRTSPTPIVSAPVTPLLRIPAYDLDASGLPPVSVLGEVVSVDRQSNINVQLRLVVLGQDPLTCDVAISPDTAVVGDLDAIESARYLLVTVSKWELKGKRPAGTAVSVSIN